ncbi:hypothetical protein LTR05_003097 [Lithohypha guttulata]|uniref:FAD-binding PCMH-type domain-containing protein n=1 Tax=Lithohypha guttulata TaxID=1690604 RepID=A0AAN7YCX0_9EURO|nr:hypothetical protein LTR05_003097 [Lithohypha guttulata]
MGSIGPTSTQKRKVQTSDVENLKALLSDTNAKITPPNGSEDYKAAIARWSMAAAKPAGLVVQPLSAKQVAIVVKYASENNIELAVKGGGHSTAGASSTDGGLLIVLESLRQVTIEDWPAEPGQKVFRIGGGASWGDVDREGVKYGLHTVGGTVADTGVGGLTLGGGYGWLSGQYGLTIDCLVEVECVLANGDIVRASEKENTDLFWALCGAGQNFGVATEFVMRAYPQGEMWIGLVLFDTQPQTIEKIVNVINDNYTPNADGRTKFKGQTMGGLGFISPPPAKGKIMTFVSIVFNGTEEQGRAAWKPLFDIGPAMDTMAMQPYPVANTFLAPPIGLRSSMKGSSFQLPLQPTFVSEVQQMYTDFFTADPEDRGITLLMFELYDPWKNMQSSHGSFANRGTHMNALICPIWKSAESDAQCRQWARDLNEMFKKQLVSQGVETSEGGAAGGVAPRSKKGGVMLYGNYDQYDERSRDIFGDNYPRLQRLKAQYDPGNVFNKLFPIYPEA